jgi:hypothetical protein
MYVRYRPSEEFYAAFIERYHPKGSTTNMPMLKTLKSRMRKLSGLTPKIFDCCINTCVAYTGYLQKLDTCHDPISLSFPLYRCLVSVPLLFSPLLPAPRCFPSVTFLPLFSSPLSWTLRVAIAMYLSYYCVSWLYITKGLVWLTPRLVLLSTSHLCGHRLSFGLCAFITSVYFGQCAT